MRAKFSVNFLTFLSAVLFVTLVFVSIFILSRYNANKNILINRYLEQLRLKHEQVEYQLDTITEDLYILSEIDVFREFINSQTQSSLQAVNQIFKLILTARKTYDHIRFINSEGMEIIRINYNGGYPRTVPDNELQFKGNRYYFKDSMKLEKGEIYFSPMDLNIEKGEIEFPEKPMLRIGIPVFDADNTRRGILILNFPGKHIIRNIERMDTGKGEDVYLINSDGYWLYSKHPERNWSFMYKDRRHVNFKKFFPGIWESMVLDQRGILHRNGDIFLYETISPIIKYKDSGIGGRDETYFWKIVIYLPKKMFRTLLLKTADDYLIAIIVAVISSAAFSFFAAKLWTIRKNAQLQMEISLREKELLLKEIHHRVKNSLSLVSSFIGLYRGKEEFRDGDFFNSLQQKIDTISLVHTHLYQSTSFKSINLESYLIILLDTMVSNFTPPDKTIKLDLAVDRIEMPAKNTISLGLIISELAMNSLKHAFTDSDEGTISIHIKRKANGCVMYYSDTGTGLPEDFSIEDADSLGMTIIDSLVKQLGGKLTVTGPELLFTLSIPECL